MWWPCFSLCLTTATTRCWLPSSGRLKCPKAAAAATATTTTTTLGLARNRRRRCFGTTTMSLSTTSTNPTASLADFLRECKYQVWALAGNKEELSPLSLVIGNPAGDADSILSAITWAYVATTTTASSSSTKSTIPILSIPRHDLMTQRPETLFLLNLAGVTPDDLVDLTDVHAARFGHAHVTLVDHNRLDTTLQESLDWTVTGVLDHHYDEGLYTNAALREIAFDHDGATVASTATLVAEHWLRQQQQQSSSPKLNSDVALLLLGTILLDSVNMSPAAGKGTARDQAVLNALLAQTDWQDGKLVRNNNNYNDDSLWDDAGGPRPTRLFERLQKAKFDVKFWKALSVRDALRLDFKRFTPQNNVPFGASTVLLDWDTFLAKDGVTSDIAAYMKEEKVSFLAIMCTYTAAESDVVKRQLVLCANKDEEPSLLDSMVDFLQKLDADSSLQLQEQAHSRVDEQLQLRVFDQGKVKASRKQVAPLLIRYFETCKA